MSRSEASDDLTVAWTTPGSASCMAMLGSALECRRLASFSAAVSVAWGWCWPALFCDVSERKLKVLDF